jgi:hypothetical protein
MEDSYRRPLMLEPGHRQEGKYEEEKKKERKRRKKSEEFILASRAKLMQTPALREDVCTAPIT